MFAVSCLLGIISGCSSVPVIIQTGDCEHGIVSPKNIDEVKKLWQDAKITDVLISGGCYQDRFVKKLY